MSLFRKLHRGMFRRAVRGEFQNLHGFGLHEFEDIYEAGRMNEILDELYVEHHGNQFLAAQAITRFLETNQGGINLKSHVEMKKFRKEWS